LILRNFEAANMSKVTPVSYTNKYFKIKSRLDFIQVIQLFLFNLRVSVEFTSIHVIITRA